MVLIVPAAILAAKILFGGGACAGTFEVSRRSLIGLFRLERVAARRRLNETAHDQLAAMEADLEEAEEALRREAIRIADERTRKEASERERLEAELKELAVVHESKVKLATLDSKKADPVQKSAADRALNEIPKLESKISALNLKLRSLPEVPNTYSPDDAWVTRTVDEDVEEFMIARARRGKKAGLASHVAMRVRSERLGGALVRYDDENVAACRRYIKEIVNDRDYMSLRAKDRVSICEQALILVFKPTREDLAYAAMRENHESREDHRYVVGMEEWIPIWKRITNFLGVQGVIPEVARAA